MDIHILKAKYRENEQVAAKRAADANQLKTNRDMCMKALSDEGGSLLKINRLLESITQQAHKIAEEYANNGSLPFYYMGVVDDFFDQLNVIAEIARKGKAELAGIGVLQGKEASHKLCSNDITLVFNNLKTIRTKAEYLGLTKAASPFQKEANWREIELLNAEIETLSQNVIPYLQNIERKLMQSGQHG